MVEETIHNKRKRLGQDARKVIRANGGQMRATDGPYSETKEVLGGFYVIEAASYDEAVERSLDHPHPEHGTIEVRHLYGRDCHAQAGVLLEHLFRHQAGRIVAHLARLLGPARLDLAEETVQKAMLRALQTWPYQGMPENPAGWLFRAAHNAAIDAVRRDRMIGQRTDAVVAELNRSASIRNDDPDFEEQLRDDELRMIFMCCCPEIPRDSRVALRLKTVGAFSVREIARGFLGRVGSLIVCYRDGMITEKERDAVLGKLTATRQLLLDTVEGVSEEQASWSPGPGRWSILQYVEHLAISDDGLIALIQRALESPAQPETLDERKAREEKIRQTPVPRGVNQAPERLRPVGRFANLAEAVEVFLAARAHARVREDHHR